MEDIVEHSIRQTIDMDIYNVEIEAEEKERAAILSLVDSMKNDM